jgi:hypothetical protein
MDPVTMTYYGVICGGLAVVSPRLSPAAVRVVFGLVVGLLAAAVLPALRQATGL